MARLLLRLILNVVLAVAIDLAIAASLALHRCVMHTLWAGMKSPRRLLLTLVFVVTGAVGLSNQIPSWSDRDQRMVERRFRLSEIRDQLRQLKEADAGADAEKWDALISFYDREIGEPD